MLKNWLYSQAAAAAVAYKNHQQSLRMRFFFLLLFGSLSSASSIGTSDKWCITTYFLPMRDSMRCFFICCVYLVCVLHRSLCVCVWWWWSWPALDTENVCVFCYCLLLLVAFDVCWFDYRLDRMCNRHQPSRLIPCTVGRPDYPQKHHIKVGAKRGHKWRKQKMNNEKKKTVAECERRNAEKGARRKHTHIAYTHL